MDVSPVRVLVVDDDERVRKLIAMSAAAIPAIDIVGEATNGVEAIAQAADLRPDLVIMDLIMPIMDGAEATREIRRHFPEVVVIGFTSDGNEGSRLVAAGAIEAIEKSRYGDLVALLIRGRDGLR